MCDAISQMRAHFLNLQTLCNKGIKGPRIRRRYIGASESCLLRCEIFNVLADWMKRILPGILPQPGSMRDVHDFTETR